MSSEVPSEHKQHNFGKLDNGQFFAQTNNRMLWYEQSLTFKELKMTFLYRQGTSFLNKKRDGHLVIVRNTFTKKKKEKKGKEVMKTVFNKDKNLDATKQQMFFRV